MECAHHWNAQIQGKLDLVRVSEVFELTGVDYYKMYYQIQQKFDLVRVSGALTNQANSS